MGYLETKSSKAMKDILIDEGFSIKDGVASIPTAFIAEYNNGGPIIGVLAEFDALPGLSQSTNPYRDSLGGDAGHACGHHLFGAASVHAAVAIKEYLKKPIKREQFVFTVHLLKKAVVVKSISQEMDILTMLTLSCIGI